MGSEKEREKESAIIQTLESNYGKYYRMGYGYVHNDADARDVVQESAYKAIYHSDKLRKPDYADTWICRIVINESINLLRRDKRGFAELTENSLRAEETYEDIDLRNALEKLPVKDKTVIMLRYFEDMSLDQVADVLNENVNTVKSRLYRALGKLKLCLGE